MGEVDTERQALNVARMRLLGAEVDPGRPPARARSRTRSTRRCATGSPTSTTTHYLFGTVAGPHPFPTMVRDFHRGHRRRGARAGAGADRPAARRRRRLRRRRLQRDRASSTRSSTTPDVRLVGFEAGGDGVDTGRHARHASPGARRRRCTARAPTCCRTRTARPSSRTRSRPASTTPASARSTPASRTSAAREYLPVTDAEAMDAFALLCRTEGIIPAIESAHALAGALRARPRAGPGRG